jgi:hypothetical protein
MEKTLIARETEKWVGPPCWAFVNGYRLKLKEAMKSGFG